MTRGFPHMDIALCALQQHQDILNPMAGIYKALEHLRPALSLSDITSSVLRNALQHNVMADVFAELSTTRFLDQIVQIDQTAIMAPIATAISTQIADQQRVFAELIRPHLDFKIDLPLNISALVDGSAIWKSCIDSTLENFHDIGFFGVRNDLIDRLLAPSRAFAAFITDSNQLLDHVLEPSRIAASNLSFKLIEGQYQVITDALGSFPAPADFNQPCDERMLTAPMAQFEAALNADFDESDTDPSPKIILLPATICAETARETVGLVCRTNEVCASAGRGEIFKPTTRFIEACADISWLVSADKKSFGDLIDCLYFIFYEGAGKDNLRFQDKNGGPLKAEEMDFIWCLKHLRNKYAHHDPDHGKPTEIAKSWAELQQKWIKLGLNNAPFRSADFLAAHQAMLEMAKDFVMLILTRLTGEESH